MIDFIRFHNFKVLKDATLRLRPFNVVVGPNGSGKSTIFKAIEAIKNPTGYELQRIITAGVAAQEASVEFEISSDRGKIKCATSWTLSQGIKQLIFVNGVPNQNDPMAAGTIGNLVKSMRVYGLDASKIGDSAVLNPTGNLSPDGSNLVAALDRLRDLDEDAFNALKSEMRGLLPEFDNIVFDTVMPNQRAFKLRQRFTKHNVPAKDLSEGTLLALCLLVLVHFPDQPELLCLEEPDKGLHPRLLRSVRDALYRLSYPEQFGLDRKPVQIILTTHSPYLLDLFKEHPEDIIIAQKHSDGTASFKSLADDDKLRQLIGDAPLGEVWYSGLLGGVPIDK
jgi:predicted ATPase